MEFVDFDLASQGDIRYEGNYYHDYFRALPFASVCVPHYVSLFSGVREHSFCFPIVNIQFYPVQLILITAKRI